MKLIFANGSNIRQVHISGKEITFLSPELKFMPVFVNLDKLNDIEYKEKLKKMNMSEEEIKTLHELSQLGSEREIADDIIQDFKKTGWRLQIEHGSY